MLAIHGPKETQRRMGVLLDHVEAKTFGAEAFTLQAWRGRIDQWAKSPEGWDTVIDRSVLREWLAEPVSPHAGKGDGDPC